jgi:hypothetical protein
MLETLKSLLILFLYDDDLLITRSLASTVVAVKDILYDMLSMIDMGPLHYFLSLEII